MTFFELGLKERFGEAEVLVKLPRLINWNCIEKHVSKVRKYEKLGSTGRRSYPVLKMFEAIILRQWNGLSDAELERSLRLQLDFMWFTGFAVMKFLR